VEFIIDWFIIGSVVFLLSLLLLRNVAAAFRAAVVLGFVLTIVLHLLPESFVQQLRGGRRSSRSYDPF
jgi:hypothetical protein